MIANLTVPVVSRKISSSRVARLIVRYVRKGVGTEVIVPFLGPSFLLWTQSVSPRLADLLVRMLKLEGSEADQT
jgi:hypothetical protein